MYRKLVVLLALVMGAAGVACQPEEPDDHLENAGEEMSEAGKDIGNEIEDACEDMKEGAGAEDTDC